MADFVAKISRAAGATPSQPGKPENALQVREQHLNALTIVPGLLGGVRNLARCTKGRVIEGCKILLDRAACASLAARSLFRSAPGIEHCLLASAAIRLASTANPSPPTDGCQERRDKDEAEAYEKELRKLHVQLCHLQAWVKQQGLRAIIVFEGATRPARAGPSRRSPSGQPAGRVRGIGRLGCEMRRERRVRAKFGQPQAEDRVTAEVGGVWHGSHPEEQIQCQSRKQLAL
jgi:hypothetical protein